MFAGYESVTPKQGFGRVAKRPEELLLICFYDPMGISTVSETVSYIQLFSQFSVTVINLYQHRADSGYLALPKCINLDPFRGIIIHNSVAYNVENLKSLDGKLNRKLKDYQGVKVLMKQDENYRFRETSKYIGDTGFDLILTCLPDESLKKIYPSSVVGDSEFERMLTGYVTPSMRRINYLNNQRPIDIGYRGSVQPLSFGRLAYEKRSIGYEVAARLSSKGLRLDISSRWEDRYGGSAWFDFLQSCKATLGSESGASIFDLDGDLDERCSDIEARLGPFREDREYAEAYLALLSDLEDNINYKQLSPRHFEAAASGTLQLLYPGRYSGVFDPEKHYFELKRDHSNLDEAVELIRDDVRRHRITQAAFEEVILNPDYWIETFVSRLNKLTMDKMNQKGLLKREKLSPIRGKSHVLLLAAHEPSIDPRLRWIEEGAPDGIRIHQLGVSSDRDYFVSELTLRGNMYMVSPRNAWSSKRFHSVLLKILGTPVGMSGAAELLFIAHALNQDKAIFSELFCVPQNSNRYNAFRWYLQYVLDVNINLVESGLHLRGIDALIATDLITLPAALILKGIFGVPVIYDAHEYWPEADVASYEFEIQFWLEQERRLTPHIDYCQTVSPALAELMGHQYNKLFACVPNCVPLADGNIELNHSSVDGKCRFLFMGSFAQGRGLDLLINVWKETDENAVLMLRGKPNAYRQELYELAKSTGLLGTRIHFLDAVSENELVQSAANADVGIIPYTPLGLNYSHCSPNKLSQYMAAQLPILANITSFVAQTIEAAECGKLVDFRKKEKLVNVINELSSNPDLLSKLRKNSKAYFESMFNWEHASEILYNKLKQLISENRKNKIGLNGSEPSCPSICQGSNYAENDSSVSLYERTQPENTYILKIEGGSKKYNMNTLLRIWHCLPESLRFRYGYLVKKFLKIH